MEDTNSTGRGNSACIRCCVGTYSDSRAGKITHRMKSFFSAALFISLPWNAFAAAGQLPGAQELNAPVNFETPAPELIAVFAENSDPGVVSEGVIAVDGTAQSVVVNQELASLDVVDTGVLKQIQNPQPASVVPRDTTSLDVVDTGASIQVQNPQPVATVLENSEEFSAALESESVSAGVASIGDDHQAKNYKVMLPVTELTNKNEVTSMVSGAGKAIDQPENTSIGVVSEEAAGLPYAVLLAILALMSMIPVARRNG